MRKPSVAKFCKVDVLLLLQVKL